MQKTAARWRIQATVTDPSEDGTADFRCQSPDKDFEVSGTVQRSAQGLIITRMEWSTDRPGGLTASMSRAFPLGELLAYLRTARELEGQRELFMRQGAAAEQLKPDARATRPRRGGRPPVTDERLREVALAYLDETGPGAPPGALARLAQRFGSPEETVRTWLGRARKDGWLGPGMKGRKGGEPGPRLLAVQEETT